MPVSSSSSGTSWSAVRGSSSNNVMNITTNIPVNAVIGRYNMSLQSTSGGRPSVSRVGTFIVLFNPWAKGRLSKLLWKHVLLVYLMVWLACSAPTEETITSYQHHIPTHTNHELEGKSLQHHHRWQLNPIYKSNQHLTLKVSDRECLTTCDMVCHLKKRGSAWPQNVNEGTCFWHLLCYLFWWALKKQLRFTIGCWLFLFYE